MTKNPVVAYVNQFTDGYNSFNAVGIITLTDEETKEYIEYVKQFSEDGRFTAERAYEDISPFIGESENDIWERTKYSRAIPKNYEMDEELLCFITFWKGYKDLNAVKPSETDRNVVKEWDRFMTEKGYYIHPDFVYTYPELSVELMKLLQKELRPDLA